MPEYRVNIMLLLSGDNWNPTTWLFFPEALGAGEYLFNLRRLQDRPFFHVLCPHREGLYPRSALDDFIRGLTDAALRSAVPVSMNRPIDTREAHPAPEQQFVFDFGKFTKEETP